MTFVAKVLDYWSIFLFKDSAVEFWGVNSPLFVRFIDLWMFVLLVSDIKLEFIGYLLPMADDGVNLEDEELDLSKIFVL